MYHLSVNLDGNLAQRLPITVTFPGPAHNVSLVGFGAIYCLGGTYGAVTAFDQQGTEIGNLALTLSDPADCGEDNITYGAEVQIPDGVTVYSLLIDPPQPWDFPVGSATGRASAYYTLKFDAGAAPLTVTCAPAVRGTSAACTATKNDPGVTIDHWTFAAPGLTGGITDQSSSDSWSGIAALSGTVTVVGTLGGQTTSAATSFVVTPRNWSQFVPDFFLNERVPSGLPTHPISDSTLGYTENSAMAYSSPEAVATIQSGPNAGLNYFTALPFIAASVIGINRVALSSGSDFYNLQPAHAGPGRCTQADVLPFVPLAEAHEGLNLQTFSHAWAFKSVVDSGAGISVELLVAETPPALDLKADSVAAIIDSVGKAASAAIDTTHPIPYCKFKYFTP